MVRCAKPYSCAAAVLWNELDARIFKSSADGSEVVWYGLTTPCFEVFHRAERYPGRFSQLALRPVEKAPRGSDLGWVHLVQLKWLT